jgi:hypothetical protein
MVFFSLNFFPPSFHSLWFVGGQVDGLPPCLVIALYKQLAKVLSFFLVAKLIVAT